MHGDNTSAIKNIYDERSEKYDNYIHTRLAQEHIENAKLNEGETVLDLACGTGLVTILAKQKVGLGRVVGIDLSNGMLEVARQKTKQQGLEIEYLEHDISDLNELDLLSKTPQGFDKIICAAAVVLLKEPLRAIQHWVSLLAPNGRLLIDANTKESMIAGSILSDIGSEIGHSLRWDSSWVQSEDSLRKLFFFYVISL